MSHHRSYIGIAPPPYVVKATGYHPMRLAIARSANRDKLIEAIVIHLRRQMRSGGNLQDAYRLQNQQ